MTSGGSGRGTRVQGSWYLGARSDWTRSSDFGTG
jgi:hypothetical protein